MLAPLCALVIQLARTPDLPPEPESHLRPRALAPFIAGLLATPGASEFECSLAEINAHLAQILLAPRKTRASVVLADISVRLESDRCHVLAKYLYQSRPFHVRTSYLLAAHDGRLRWEPDSAQLGKVQLGKAWVARLDAPLRKLLPLLKKERVFLGRARQILIEPNRVKLVLRPATAAPSLL